MNANEQDEPIEITDNDEVKLSPEEIEVAARRFMELYMVGFAKVLADNADDLRAAEEGTLDESAQDAAGDDEA